MEQNIDPSLALKLLKKIQADAAHIRERVDEYISGLHGETNRLRNEIIRLEKHISQSLERVERRLDRLTPSSFPSGIRSL